MKKINVWSRFTISLIFIVNLVFTGHSIYASQANIPYIPMVQVGHTNTVEVVAISPDQRFMVTGGRDVFVTLWRLKQKQILKRFVLDKGPAQQLLFHPDGQGFMALVAGEVFVFAIKSEGGVKVPVKGLVDGIGLNAKNQLVMVGKKLFVWDFAGQRLVKHKLNIQFKGKKNNNIRLNKVVLSHQAQWLARGYSTGLIELWDINTGKLKRRFELKGSVKDMAFSPDLSFFVAASRDKTASLFKLPGTALYANQLKHKVNLTVVAFSSNSQFLATGDRRGTIKLWQLSNGKRVEQFKDTQSVTALVFYPDNLGLLSTGRDQSLRRYFLAHLNDKSIPRRDSKPFQPFTAQERLMAVAADANVAVSLGRNSGYANHLRSWDLNLGKLTKNFELPKRWGVMTALDVSANGRTVIYGSKEGIVNINVPLGASSPCFTRKQINESSDFLCHRFRGDGLAVAQHQGVVLDVGFSSDGSLAVSSSEDGEVKVWDLATYKQIKFFRFKKPALRAMFMPGNQQLAVLLNQRFPGDRHSDKLVLVDLENGSKRPVAVKQGYELLMDGLAEQLVVVGNDGFYRYHWPTDVLGGHRFAQSNSMNVAALSVDGKQLVVGSQFTQGLAVFDMNSGKKLHDFSGYRAKVDGLGILPDTGLLTVASEGLLKVFDISAGAPRVSISGSLDAEWVATTPDGFYNSTLDGANNVLIVPKDKSVGYGVERFAAVLKRPDIIKKRLTVAVPEYVATGLETYVIPTIEIQQQNDKLKTNKSHVPLSVRVSDDTDKIEVYVNAKLSQTLAVNGERTVKINVSLLSRYNRISVIAYNRMTSSVAEHLSVASSHRDFARPKLHVLSVGINNYGGTNTLDLAVADAKMISTVFNSGTLYADVSSTLLTDEQASPENIVAQIQRLSQASANDVVMVYLAGHGIVQDGEFVFKTIGDKSAGVEWSEMVKALNGLSANTLVVLDACHSGAAGHANSVDSQLLVSGLVSPKQGGLMVFSAAKGRQQAHENASQSNSVFNEALVKGLTTMAPLVDVDNNGVVGVKELVSYVTEQVMLQTHKEQTPWLANQQFFDDLPLMKYR